MPKYKFYYRAPELIPTVKTTTHFLVYGENYCHFCFNIETRINRMLISTYTVFHFSASQPCKILLNCTILTITFCKLIPLECIYTAYYGSHISVP